jgi:hypothetical protein
MTDAVYEDDEKLASILDVLKASELFGEIISVRSIVDEDMVDVIEDDWVDVQTKYGHDTDEYEFEDGTEIRAASISLETEPVSGHDWVSSVQIHAHALMISLDGMSECGKPLSECSNFECKHTSFVKSAEWLPQERYEFKQDWNSIADRPTENFFMGLPGLRYIETDQTHFTNINTVCNHCYLYTPTRLATCQNCDRLLVAA